MTFTTQDADNYFARNAGKYTGREPHHEVPALLDAAKHIGTARRILEVGCANGYLGNLLAMELGADQWGFDLSPVAIADGMRRFPGAALVCEGIDEFFEVEDNFDVIFLGFSAYLMPNILDVLGKCDRYLEPGGFMIVVDFDHPQTSKLEYSHNRDAYSYRHRIVDTLLATRLYSLVYKTPTAGFNKDPYERISLSLLYKEPQAYALANRKAS